MNLRLLIVFFSVIPLLSCSLPTAGGSGTETINTFVALASGAPASGAVVKVIDAEGWMDSICREANPVLDSAVVDRGGFLSLKASRSRIVNIQIDRGTEGRFLRFVSAGQFDGDTLYLDSVFTMSATVNPAEAENLSFRLSGTTYQSSAQSPGRITLSGIPSGAYTLIALGNPTNWRPLILRGLNMSFQSNLSDTLQISFENLLIDDFETGIGPTTISNLFRGITWYTYSDAGAKGWDVEKRMWTEISDTFETPGNSSIEVGSADDGRGGKAALFEVSLDRSINPPWAGAGFYLVSSGKTGVDLSEMESISFRARGRGNLTIRLETAAYDSIGSGHSQFSAIVNLTDSWQVHTIPVSSLYLIMPLDSSQQFIPWKVASESVNKVEFEFAAGDNPDDPLELYLDDIYLNGVTADVFLRD
ncbi:MAG: hypothetical protein GX089_09085 [Fibrobacter sp.]|nr:hypothetical protein [Fibrobacter sp.]